MAVKIDKGVPLPTRSSVRASVRESKWPWREMKPGDSFFAAGYAQTTAQRVGNELTMSTAAGSKLLPGTTWATRLVTENGVRGVRVWRVT